MRYTRGAVAIAAATSLLLLGCSDDTGEESVDSALAVAEAEAEALRSELDSVKAENEELSAALGAETEPAAEEAAVEEATGEAESPVTPNPVDVAERWGEALEVQDSEALRALYEDSGDTIERTFLAIWRDVDEVVERVTNNQLEFDDVDLLRVEQFRDGFITVAEYEAWVYWGPGDAGDRHTFIVVFHGLDDDGLIEGQDIYFNAWSSLVTGQVGGWPQRTGENEGDWIVID
jgi:hypothetical protein